MGEPQKHVKLRRPDAKNYLLYDAICMKYAEKANL